MSETITCNTTSLDVYVPTTENPWDREKVMHAYRRIAFGATEQEISNALSMTPSDFIDGLVDEAINLAPTEAPFWAFWGQNDFTNFNDDNIAYLEDWQLQAFDNMLNHGLRERLSLFWSNHFVTQLESYFCASYLYQYYNVLQTYAIGNFKDFVHDIGLTPAMLVYLNGLENTKFSPNENYARELYELFTLGANNGYTQQDIEETSRALTGYNGWTEYCGVINFTLNTFDNTEKTIFEQVGEWNYGDVINILFEQKDDLIATYICRKLYTYFVSPSVNEDIVAQMAATFLDSDNLYEIAPVLRQLFKSQHFFDKKVPGVIVKSPIDLTIGYLKETGFTITEDNRNALIYFNGQLGQRIFDPVDVAGWQRDHDWINSSTLTARWLIHEWMLWWVWNNDQEEFRNFALELAGGSNDPAFITKAIVDRLVTNGFQTASDYDNATDIFKGDVPENYYTDGTWNLFWDTAPWQIINLFFYIIKMPEYQLK